MSDVVGIVLAAGRGARYREAARAEVDKLLQRDALGTGLLRTSVLRMRAALETVIVVLPPNAESLRASLEDLDVRITVAPDADAGMGRSLAAGIAAASLADGWVVALGDMPAIRPETIALVARALREGCALAAPSHDGRRGHPVGFAARFREDLLNLAGDEGARAVLARHADLLRLLPGDDAGVLFDVDTPDDLAAWRASAPLAQFPPPEKTEELR